LPSIASAQSVSGKTLHLRHTNGAPAGTAIYLTNHRYHFIGSNGTPAKPVSWREEDGYVVAYRKTNGAVVRRDRIDFKSRTFISDSGVKYLF
jgi:hypothetical protein